MIRNIETLSGSPMNDRYLSLVMRLRIPQNGNANCPKMIGVVGIDVENSAHTIANCLAYCAAHELGDRTLLVDLSAGSMRKNRQSPKPSQVGMSELFSGQCCLEECIQPAPDMKNLFLLSSGNSPLTIRPSNFGMVCDTLTSLRDAYDFVVVQLPTISETQTATIASKMDGNLLVIESEQTPVERAKRAQAILQDSHARTLGVVLSNWQDHIPAWLSRRT